MKINKLILASNSPRRIAILSTIVKNLIVLPQDVEESFTAMRPQEIVIEVATRKLGALPSLYFDVPIVTADTIVWFNEKVYGKPYDKVEAKRMLSELSGQYHQVYTGVVIAFKGKTSCVVERSDIKFKNLTTQEIENYIKSGSPLDKAGAYGIQDGVVVDNFIGDLQNIIGFPLDKFLKLYDNIVR